MPSPPSRGAPPPKGPYTPTLILHGGAGALSRHNLPPQLYRRYRASLLSYLRSTRIFLHQGGDALDAACRAVCLMEDDVLFNCGRGSVFDVEGGIEMEASVMVASVLTGGGGEGGKGGGLVEESGVKRGAAAGLVRETRHPVLLAREVLREGGDGLGAVRSMHGLRVGREVEEWGWGRGLERKGQDWFWTRRRWEEHLRDLERGGGAAGDESCEGGKTVDEEEEQLLQLLLPSQGTVGAVCLDSWGNVAVATSTGGLTNKAVGRIGDTPTVGAGFWAESWGEEEGQSKHVTEKEASHNTTAPRSWTTRLSDALRAGFGDVLQECLPLGEGDYTAMHGPGDDDDDVSAYDTKQPPRRPVRKAVAMSGTGNGDSFLRTNAVRTAAARVRFGADATLAEAVDHVAGPGGELQRSAGDRWGKTFEGEGGIIGIEVDSEQRTGQVVFGFNCGGMWRAWIDGDTGTERCMVFRDEYEDTTQSEA